MGKCPELVDVYIRCPGPFPVKPCVRHPFPPLTASPCPPTLPRWEPRGTEAWAWGGSGGRAGPRTSLLSPGL